MNNTYLYEKIKSFYPQEISSIIPSLTKEKYLTIRINTLKTNMTSIISTFQEQNINYELIPHNPYALVLPNSKKEELTKLPLYENGYIYLQSLSSQLPPLILNPKKDELILDMAAAPGGKTTELAMLTNNQAMITAVEKDKIRSERLKYNIARQGAKKVTVLNTNALYLDEYFMFDKILLDAPCSGSGTTTPINNLNEETLKKITNTQLSLLESAIKHLKINGELIYSTCSILKEENEEIISTILSKYPNIELIPLKEEILDIPCLNSTIPHVLTIKPNNYYEGFFIAKLKKTS